MNINNPIIRNISLLKTKQDKDTPKNPNSHREVNSSRKSKIVERKLNKSQIKEKEKSPLMKFTTKTNFDLNSNVNNKKENLYVHTEMKKNLTQRLFAQTNNNVLNFKEDQNFKDIKTSDISNSNSNHKQNKDFKIKVTKVFDLNELTVYNITNDNTTSSNKNQENKAFDKLDSERFKYFKHNPQNQLGGFIVEKFDCKVNQKKVEKDLEICESHILKEFPIFNNNIFIKENLNFTNNHLEIETLPNVKYSEINSLNESYYDNGSNSSLINRSIKNNFIKIEKLNQVSNNIQCEKNIKKNDDNNLSLDEKVNAKSNNHCSNENNEKYGATIKETFTLFLENNSKKEFLNEEKSFKIQEDTEKTKSRLKNETTDRINSNSKSSKKTYTETNKKTNNSGKAQDMERHNVIQKLTNKFHSPNKNRSDLSKTKNCFSPFLNSIANFNHNSINNSISDLSKKLENCDSMLTNFQLNKKLKSEVEILTEKVKTLKKIHQTKNHEIEVLKSKYSEAIENYKREMEINKKSKEKIDKQNLLVKSLKKNFKILANNIIEITELLLLSKSSAEKRASLIATENASLSIDIYDSYINEDEKKSLLQEQIQSLLLEKFYYFKKQLNLNLEAEIEKIKNWNSNINFLSWKNTNSNNNLNNFNNNNNIEMSISNIKITALNKNNENESSDSSSKKNISQDYFDMSISNQFLNLNQITSGNFGNLGSNINININQSPQFIFTNNNYNSKQNPHIDSFGINDGEGDNIFGSNSNKNYNSNANSNNNYNLNVNSNTNNNANKNLVNYSSNKERNSKCNLYNFGGKDNNCINNNSNNCNINKNKWTVIFNKEEQTEINNYNWNKLNYNSNNREERFRIDSIYNQIGANGINKNVGLSSNYNSNSYNIFDSFLQSAKGPNDSFPNSPNDSILQIVNLNNANSDKENKPAYKSDKHLQEVGILKDIANDSLGKISDPVDLKEQINKIQNDSYNFILEESKAKLENYNSDNEIKKKFICDELVNSNINNNNVDIENFKDNFSEKNDGNQLKKMFSFEL